MRQPITAADLDTAELAVGSHRAVADQLVAWARDPQPDDVVTAKELLTRAGEQLEMVDDGQDEALELYRRAAAAPGAADLDPRCHLLAVLLRRGDLEEAREVDRDLRRSRPTDALVYEYNAGSWAAHDAQRALGWYNRGIRQHETGGGFSADDLGSLCWQRRRFRERLGHAPDDYDIVGTGWARSRGSARGDRAAER